MMIRDNMSTGMSSGLALGWNPREPLSGMVRILFLKHCKLLKIKARGSHLIREH